MQFHDNIIERAKANAFFRQECATGEHSQVVVMSLLPGEDIGEEVHTVDQILVFVVGDGEAILNGETKPVHPNDLIVVPAGTTHNFRNTGTTDMKLYTIYAPPQHKPGTVHKTKAEAEAAEHGE
ncbi:MAG: cupin domain-containing protein [bacterium]